VDFNIQDTDLHRYEHGLTRIPPRVAGVLPTIKFLINKGAKVVLLSHRGRPNKTKSYKLKTKNYSLKPFAKILSKLLKRPVRLMDFKGGFNTSKIRNTITRDSIILLENLRFFPGEGKNDKKFARQLASLGDFYVNDAFSVSHRKNASVVAIAEFLPSYAGLLLEAELKNLSAVMKKPKHPLVVILGGAKISDKIGVIRNLFKKTDWFLIGGGVANTFFASQKLPINGSLYEKDMISLARRLLRVGKSKIILPFDSAVKNGIILDIGPMTIREYAKIIKGAKTIIWNGPMGYIENPEFIKGSKGVAKAVLSSRAFSVIGGGETTSLLLSVRYPACAKASAGRQSSSKAFVSTGGGAMLEYLAGKKLPGVNALN
jgi:phosphoglycerate kinase